MSTQSGIKPSPELVSTFAEASSSSAPKPTRAFSVAIESESMVLFASKPTVGDWEADWDTVVPSLTEDKTPRFILYRLDTRSKVGWEWTVIEWIPDGARVRDKMLYAASKATLTKTLGQAQFTDSVYATVPSDVTLESYKKHLESKAAGGPLSETEKLLQTVKMEEAAAEQIMQRRTPVPSARVTAPIDADTKTALERFDREGDRLGLVVLLVDGETIKLADAPVSETLSTSTAGQHIPSDEPRFIVYRYKRRSEPSSQGHVVFIYSCPPSSKIKQKMVYSSSKAGLLAYLEKDLGMKLARKYEVDGPSEVTDDLIEPDLVASGGSSNAGVAAKAAASPTAPKLAFKRPVAPGRPRTDGGIAARVAAFEKRDEEAKTAAPAPAPKPVKPKVEADKPAENVPETRPAADVETAAPEQPEEDISTPVAEEPAESHNVTTSSKPAEDDDDAPVKDDEWD